MRKLLALAAVYAVYRYGPELRAWAVAWVLGGVRW